MTLTRPEDTFGRTQAQLTQLWRDLMGTEGFHVRSIWLILLNGNGQLSPVIVPIDGITDEPDDVFIENFRQIVAGILDDFDDGHAAVLMSRPGPAQFTTSDRRWLRALSRSLQPHLGGYPLHFAIRGQVRVVAPDDLVE